MQKNSLTKTMETTIKGSASNASPLVPVKTAGAAWRWLQKYKAKKLKQKNEEI